MKPIIGITLDCKHDPEDDRSHGTMSLNWNYAQAISEAGGVPIIIPPTADLEEISRLLDGWLIPGGRDIDPEHWNEPTHPRTRLQDPRRYEVEAELHGAADPDMPILGICYGCQFVNVVRGGSLIQDLGDVVSTDHTGGAAAEYAIAPGSKLAEVVGASRMEGKSYHHQAIGKVGEGLRTVARHADGTIEAIEATDRPWVIGVQWHPERTLGDTASRRLFEGFVRAAAAFRSARSVAAR